jgi:pimeloyl-ACP methyl ester carboxylesterase
MSEEDQETALCYNIVVPPQVRLALISRQIDSDDVLSEMTIPVLVTHGDQDIVALPSMAEHVLAVCPTAEASWYEGVGHAPFLEDPERFNRELADFTRRVNA